MRITVLAKPNKPKTELISADPGKNTYLIHLKARPENNKANIELLKFLKKHFRKEVSIVSGFTSKKKIIELK
ncbi:DUF167 domain-containing protein [Candidatus Woesearchaeota archaeon]|nr:DUF167 domain-containing protein [Candidatus Woesearchaeota archaeon]